MANDTVRNIGITIRNLKEQFGVTVEIGTYAPGDGWKRYSVTVDGWVEMRNSMNARECECYVSGLYDMMRSQNDQNRQRAILAATLANQMNGGK